MKNQKILFILIIIFCTFALIAGIYAQFFVPEEEKNNIIIPDLNLIGGDEVIEKTQEEIKTSLTSLFTNKNEFGTFYTDNIQKMDTQKEIVYEAFNIKEKKDNYEIEIHLPVINIAGEVPVGFNNITQNKFANKASEILSNRINEKVIYTVNYVSYINEDILSVIIESAYKEGSKPQKVMIETYNYNLLTGEKVELSDILVKKNIVQSECQNKIDKVIQRAQEEAQILVQSGYTVYNRDLESSIYEIDNVSTFFWGQKSNLYIIFAYGNENDTSQMDIVLYE